jgi:hypothetical protein
MSLCRVTWRAGVLAACTCVAAFPADAPVVPLTVCEVLRDLPAHQGKNVAVLGRYSFRTNGRWMGEQACDPASVEAPQLLLQEDPEGPKPPDQFELDGVAVTKKLTEVQRRTSLGKFRFGTPDYDRWAVIWGRVAPGAPGDKRAAANLVFRGNGVIVFLTRSQ